MTQYDDAASIAAQLQRAWEAGRICPLIGAGARDRVLALSQLAEAGRLPREEALQLAREVEGVAYCFAPLPYAGDVL